MDQQELVYHQIYHQTRLQLASFLYMMLELTTLCIIPSNIPLTQGLVHRCIIVLQACNLQTLTAEAPQRAIETTHQDWYYGSSHVKNEKIIDHRSMNRTYWVRPT
jgi:hypothetical protein